MNKKNMMIMAGLMLSVATQAFSVGEQQKDVAYTMKALGQPFAQSPLIRQNVDVLIDPFGMNIKINEKKLQEISIKKTLAKSAAVIGGISIARELSEKGVGFATKLFRDDKSGKIPKVILSTHECMVNAIVLSSFAAICCVALNLYDTFKSKNALNASLALDKEILAELTTIKEFAEKPLI